MNEIPYFMDSLEINKVHNMECVDLIEGLPENCIDAIITDFPYGIDFQSNHRTKKFKKIDNDKEPYIDWIKPSFRILKDGGRIVCFYRYDVQDVLFNELVKSGFTIKSQLVWNKIGTGMGDLNGEFAPQHELMVYATKGRYEFKNGRPSTVYSVQKVNDLIHPNEKPVKLMQGIIRDVTVKSDFIFEPFSGSGSTCVACKIEKRDFIACETQVHNVEISNKRLSITNSNSLF